MIVNVIQKTMIIFRIMINKWKALNTTNIVPKEMNHMISVNQMELIHIVIGLARY